MPLVRWPLRGSSWSSAWASCTINQSLLADSAPGPRGTAVAAAAAVAADAGARVRAALQAPEYAVAVSAGVAALSELSSALLLRAQATGAGASGGVKITHKAAATPPVSRCRWTTAAGPWTWPR